MLYPSNKQCQVYGNEKIYNKITVSTCRYAILQQVHHLKTLNKNVLTHLSYYVQQQLKANLQLQNAKHSNLQIDEEVITPFTEVDGKIISVETNVRS